jgi:hypothetical protein
MTTATRPNHEPTARDVDNAVRAVLAERLRPRAALGGPAGAAVVFAGRLLSLRSAETLPTGTRQVRVSPGTVVTPLASDHLRRLGIEVRQVARSEVEPHRNAGEWGFAVERTTGLMEALRRAFLDGPEGWREVGASLDEAAEWVAETDRRGALVLTDEASVAVYRACQLRGVRAATAEEPDAVGRAVRALGINVLVVEPAGKPLALVRQLGATFRRGGGPVPPAWLGNSSRALP